MHRVNRCRGDREPRSGAVMRIMGCLEMGSGWCFREKHVKGVANTLADGISRWDRSFIPANLHAFRPDVNWQEQNLGGEGTERITDVGASSTSADQLRFRLGKRTSRVADLGTSLAGWCFTRGFGTPLIWKSTRCGFWLSTRRGVCCEAEGNLAGTISEKLVAVQYFHWL